MALPGWDKSVLARRYLMTASGPAIIIGNWIAEVHGFHKVAPQGAALRNGSVQISEGYVSDMPLVALFRDSSKSNQDPISLHDHHLGPRPVNWGLEKANIGRFLEEWVSVVRSDARHSLLKAFYVERMALLASNDNSPTLPTTFSQGDSRGFQCMIKRWYGGLTDTASVNSRNAHFSMGGIKVRKSPHNDFTRFEWTMPHSLATEVIVTVLNSTHFINGDLYAMRLSNLGAPNTFQLVPNRDLKRDRKDIDSVEVHNTFARSDKGKQCGLLGAGIKNSTGMLYVLDVAKVGTTGDLPPLNSLAHSLFFDTHLVMFRGASSFLVQFCESKGMMSPELVTTSPQSLWPKPKGDTKPPEPLIIEVAAPKDELSLNVQIVVSLLVEWTAWVPIDSISASESLHRVTFLYEGSCSIAQEFFLVGIRTKPLVSNPALCSTLLQAQQVDQQKEEPALVKTIQAGRAFD